MGKGQRHFSCCAVSSFPSASLFLPTLFLLYSLALPVSYCPVLAPSDPSSLPACPSQLPAFRLKHPFSVLSSSLRAILSQPQHGQPRSAQSPHCDRLPRGTLPPHPCPP
eukprot:2905611-Rhodomonas_salina.3